MSEIHIPYQTLPPPKPIPQVTARLVCDHCQEHGIEAESFTLTLLSNGMVRIECENCQEIYLTEEWQDMHDIFSTESELPE